LRLAFLGCQRAYFSVGSNFSVHRLELYCRLENPFKKLASEPDPPLHGSTVFLGFSGHRVPVALPPEGLSRVSTFSIIFVAFCIPQSFTRTPGADPTIASYNASAVKIYNATSSIVRFEDKILFLL
jgi:hypothetical protein